MPGSTLACCQRGWGALMVREHLRGLTGSKSTKEGSKDSCPGGGAELEALVAGRMGLT